MLLLSRERVAPTFFIAGPASGRHVASLTEVSLGRSRAPPALFVAGPASGRLALKSGLTTKGSMTHYQMAVAAIRALDERAGSSPRAIAKFIETQLLLPSPFKPRALRIALKKHLAAGDIVQVKRSFKLAPTKTKKTEPATLSRPKNSKTKARRPPHATPRVSVLKLPLSDAADEEAPEVGAPAVGAGVGTSAAVARGVVDLSVAALDARVAARGAVAAAADGSVLHVGLSLVDPSVNSDKFYIIQALELDGASYVFTRWGRTGTTGQCRLEGGVSLTRAAATARFASKVGGAVFFC